MNHDKYLQIIFSVIVASFLLMGLFLFLCDKPQTTYADPTYLFVTPDGGGDCSQATPCNLQTALNSATDGNTLYVAGGSYTGSGTAVISLTHSITLYGGWDGAPTGGIIRDIALYPTTLDGEGQRRVVYINAGITPTLDGFTLTGGNATGLGGGLTAGSEAGGGLYSRNASPTLQNNVITNNVGSTQSGIRAFGGGLYISNDTTSAIIRQNQILSNTAGIAIQQGDGGAFFVNGTADILSNTMQDNVACVNCSAAYGGGGYIGWTSSDIILAHNLFKNNQADRGGGLALVWSAAHVQDNTFLGNTAVFGAGLDSYYDGGSTIHANMILSNTATGPGNGIRIYITTGTGATTLVNNIIANNQGASGAGIYAYSDWHNSAITLTHNTLANNGDGLKIGQNMTATLVNNIVASHTVGLSVVEPSGNLFADHTLFWGNSDDGLRGTLPVDSDPAFVNPAMNNYHLSAGSGAIDMGIDAGVLSDIDGESRPVGAGYDIGADEFWYAVSLPLIMR